RTKDDLIAHEIGQVFKAKNLIEVMRKSHEAREKLLRLGVFRNVEVLIDTCEGEDALPNGLDVTFEVTELRRLTGSYNTMVGNNEGSMVLGLKLPNLFGRAEKMTFQFSYGTKETSYGLSFFKPQVGNFERNFSVNLYKVTGQFPWSSLRETDRGVSQKKTVSLQSKAPITFPSAPAPVSLQSKVPIPFPSVPAPVSLQSKVPIPFPSVPAPVSLQSKVPIPFPSVPAPWGHLLDVWGGVRNIFVFTFPPGDYLGGEAYWAGGMHLYTPLPFRPGRGGFGDLFRTHFFLNAGNLCNLNYGEGPRAHLRRLAECIRWSYGAGIVLRLGNIARLELNYCIPMGVQSGDRICDGVQFGAGIRFL
uniref:Sorting and assembly machinery component 50 homolog n=1 Tax=Xenopus tropicalis TaxID=8364 RepID=A0A6I8RAM5_XENTR